jgi:hypothetical protein
MDKNTGFYAMMVAVAFAVVALFVIGLVDRARDTGNQPGGHAAHAGRMNGPRIVSGVCALHCVNDEGAMPWPPRFGLAPFCLSAES